MAGRAGYAPSPRCGEGAARRRRAVLHAALLTVVLILGLGAMPVSAQSVDQRVIEELTEDGYTEIRRNRTLLGRMRYVATRSGARREIVVNPSTGVILRDYEQIFVRGGDEDDDDDDRDDDDDDDDDDAHDDRDDRDDDRGGDDGDDGDDSEDD